MAEAGGRRRSWRLSRPGRPGPLAETCGPEADFLRFFEAAPDAQALLDAEGRILAANPALARLAGPAVPPYRGLPVGHLLAPAARPALAGRLAAALSGVPGPAPLHAAPADPAAPPDAEWVLRCRALRGRGTQPPRLLLDVRDRTEQRRAAGRLAAAARLEAVGRLAGGIAHDFNNLLGAVLGAAEGMRAAGWLAPAAAAELGTIEDAARRGAALVRQLLAFARQQQLQPRVLDLNAAAEGLAPLLPPLVGGRVRVELALETPGRRVRVDPTQLDRVLVNLAANARDAMADGGGTLRLTTGRAVVLRPEGEGVQTLPPGRYVVLEVSDTGTGIPPEALPRLFEPFFTTRPDRGGTGLGLATVQGIVAQSGGHVTVSSRPGEGTTFRIHLPRYEGDEPAGPASAPTEEATRRAPAPPDAMRATGHILLVEDEAPLRRMVERLLARAGRTVAAVDSAEAALALVEGEGPPPAALVSDVAMPGMDGLALARRLRSRWPALPVLLLSGYAEVTLGEDLEGQGIRFLAKPFEPAALVAAVAELARAAAGTAGAGA